MKRVLKVVGIFFSLAAVALHSMQAYVCSACMEIEDDFLRESFVDKWNSDLCEFLGRPMTIMILFYIYGCLFSTVFCLYGVWKTRHAFLLPWLALQPAGILSEISFMIQTTSFAALSITTVIHIILFMSGIYIHHFIVRYSKKQSFA